jgi:tRNA pseudouridine55 synthase
MDGILLIDKPAGITSHDVVARVRGALAGQPYTPDSGHTARSRTGRPKTGHAGTLDPFATGLLIVMVGRATKLQRTLMGLPKSYEAIARLGATSTTGDPEGEIEITGRIPPDPPSLPVGEIRQRPPIFSAVKVGGERAYRRARRGETFELPERIVTVTRYEQLWREDLDQADGTARAAFAIDCSSGTYVRSLIADLGDAYCEQLRRTAIGPFRVEDAVAPPPPKLGDTRIARVPVSANGERWPQPPLIAPGDALAAAERYVA